MQYIQISHIITFFFFGTCIHFCFLVPLKVCFCKPKYRPNNDQLTVFLLSIEDLEIQVYTDDFSIFTGLSLWFCLFQRFWKRFLIERESKYYFVEKDNVNTFVANIQWLASFPQPFAGPQAKWTLAAVAYHGDFLIKKNNGPATAQFYIIWSQ